KWVPTSSCKLCDTKALRHDALDSSYSLRLIQTALGRPPNYLSHRNKRSVCTGMMPTKISAAEPWFSDVRVIVWRPTIQRPSAWHFDSSSRMGSFTK
uniref:Zf-RVT domain-containing protein n=1 Tax=Haemonchus contortus TaxID=6289 RepID=A0A7I4YHB6_HAECO